MPRDAKPVATSTLVEMPLDQKEASFYKNVLQLLNRHRIPYAIAGAFALHQHTGIWRVTKDLDVFLTAESLSRAVSILSKRGFKCEITDAVWLAKVRKGRFFIDLITGMWTSQPEVGSRCNYSWLKHSLH